MTHIQILAGEIGVREAGTQAETAALGYAADYLAGLGYDPAILDVPLPNGRLSHNLIAVKPGVSPYTVVVGAHIDSKAPSPGANDNGSGVAVVLELANDLRQADTTATFEFVLFGCEEMIDANEDHHHYGSRTYVDTMTMQRAKTLVGMLSVDMIAFGDTFAYRTMGRGPRALSDMIGDFARKQGVKMTYQRDPGPYGWSDHEPFELAGYPAVWLERVSDPAHHEASDTPDHCNQALVQKTGDLIRGFLKGLDQSRLEALAAARAR
jgi:aminopeptidase YwaD